MCNACGFYCCAFDGFDGCGCDCPSVECRMVRCDYCGRSTDGLLDDCPCAEDEYWDDPSTLVVASSDAVGRATETER